MKHRKLRILGVAVATAAALAGCTDARKERLEGARRALAALPDVEVVGADAAGVLTLRSRSSGATTTVDLGAKSAADAAPLAAAASAASAGAAPSDAASDAGAAGGADAAGSTVGGDGENAQASDLQAGASGTAAPGTSAAADGATATPGTVASAATVAAANADAPTVVRDPQGRVQVIQGSGFRIERAPGNASPAGAAAARPAPGAATADAAKGARQRLSVPVVCGAGETRALQGVEIDVPGAGVVAERGCNLTIANVRVRSGGWGLVVNPGATVRVDDSLIEGRTGALDLYPGASLSSWATTFRGALGRPAVAPQFVDRGGNNWQ